MKPRTLASIGAVLLYLWCEMFQASPFAFLEHRGRAAARPTAPSVSVATEDDQREDLRELFGSVRLAR